MGTFATHLANAGAAVADAFETSDAITYSGTSYDATLFQVERELRKMPDTGTLYHANVRAVAIRDSVLPLASIKTNIPVTIDSEVWTIVHKTGVVGGRYELTLETALPGEIGRKGYRR